MKLTFAGVVADAWGLFRRDADLLLRIAGVFMFFPAFALTLLVPPMPVPDGNIADATARAEQWTNALGDWLGGYGIGFVIAYAAVYFGWAIIAVLYCDPARPDIRGAVARAARIYPRFFLAMLLVSLPAGLGMWVLVIPGLYVVGRTLPVAAILLAERPVGAWRAIRRSLVLTRGNGMALIGLAAFAYLFGLLAGQPFLLLDHWLRTEGGANPVAVAMADALAAAAATATQVALVLFAIVSYRRLAR